MTKVAHKEPYVMKPWEQKEEGQPMKGSSQDFNIGHLNIGGAIKKKLRYLQHILETGSYDIFGVTEIHLSETDETDIGITGYYVMAYPSPYGITDRRGIAIYIKHTLSIMEMNIAPQKQEGIEMVNVTFNHLATKLKIIFLYRPGVEANLARFKNILKASSEVPGVKSIIMGDMNINWLIETNRFHIHGVQQLVTEVTRPESGTAIDHIWITRDIIHLLKDDEENCSLLDNQEIINVLSHNQPSPDEQRDRLKEDQTNLEKLHGLLRLVPSYMNQESNFRKYHSEQLEKMKKKINCVIEGVGLQCKQLNDHLYREQPEHQMNRKFRVDQFSNTTTYNVQTVKGIIKGTEMSDHSIIRISLKKPIAPIEPPTTTF